MMHPHSSTTRRGMTLIEVTVIGTVGVLLMGIVLGIFIQTSRATDRIMRRDSATQYARMTLTTITDALGDAIPSENLKSPSGGMTPLFSTDALAFFTAGDGQKLGLYHVDIGKTTPDESTGRSLVAIQANPVGSTGEPYTDLSKQAHSFLPSNCATALEFAYAKAAAPGQVPNYQPTWPEAGWPDLVRVKLTLTLGETPEQPLVFETAVIPGRVNHAVRPVPVATPAPTPQPVVIDTPTTPTQPAPAPAANDAATTPAQTEVQG